MNASDSIINYIQSKEGYSSTVYADAGGILTAGYGHTGSDVDALGLGASINTDQAVSWLNQDIANASDVINNLMDTDNVSLNQNQFDALVSFEYNTGSLTSNETLWKMIESGANPVDIAVWWKNHYIMAAGRQLQGLVDRRSYEADLFLSPVTGLKKKS